MRVESKSSYDRALRLLPKNRKQQAKETALELFRALKNRQPIPAGLGLKIIKRPYWEIRSNLGDRIVFSWEKDLIQYLFVGNHDEIHRYLKRL